MRRIVCLIISFFFLLTCLTLTHTDKFTNTSALATFESKGKKIIIDPGHGGFDGGAVASDGTVEKDINLSVALKLNALLGLCGYDVIMTRRTEEGIESDSSQSISKRKVSDMKRRLEIINNNPNAIFVSIHLNKFETSSVKGAQVFYSPNNPLSKNLAEEVQSCFSSMLQLDNKRLVKKADSSIYLLKNAKIPAIIAECGFLSNPEELAVLKSDEYQVKTALVICNGIYNYFLKNPS